MSKIVVVLTSMVLAVLLAGTTAALNAVPSVGQTTTVTLVGAGDIADCSNTNDEATAVLLSNIPGTVITLGDDAYANGTSTQFANCYDNYRLSDHSVFDSSRSAWWGQFKKRTMPTLGNHEYLNSSDSSLKSQPYFDYFRAQNGFLQPAAPVPYPGLTKGKGYYSYDLGSWHIVALNSNCDYVSCGGKSTQAQWLRNDLTSHPARCTLAYMHHPLYASGTGSDTPEVKLLWQILYNHHAEVILSGHAHRYERFRRINPDDQPDSVNGIRHFIVGTGGEPGGVQFGENDPNMQVKNTDTPGVIKLSLSAGSYTWKFVPIAGKTFTDSGSDQCH
jgi:hypothetical protein